MNTDRAERLLAHELTHVVQQNKGTSLSKQTGAYTDLGQHISFSKSNNSIQRQGGNQRQQAQNE